MKPEQAMRQGLFDELEKIASDLTETARALIAKKNFALTSSQSTTGKPAYPIQDAEHARSALRLVGMHGSDYQKAEVKKDVYRKYPELGKAAAAPAAVAEAATGGFGNFLRNHSHALDVAGLTALTVPPADTLQAHIRAGVAGDKRPDAVKRRQFLGEGAHAAGELGGLGVLMSPSLAKLRGHG